MSDSPKTVNMAIPINGSKNALQIKTDATEVIQMPKVKNIRCCLASSVGKSTDMFLPAEITADRTTHTYQKTC